MKPIIHDAIRIYPLLAIVPPAVDNDADIALNDHDPKPQGNPVLGDIGLIFARIKIKLHIIVYG